ncbi:MAG: FAD-dependent oxidoreductase [Bacteroidia bacterium]|nr:FAD-dependent oxidoreductase [Bacteroidia bacterium]
MEDQTRKTGKISSGKHLSFWTDSDAPLTYRPLQQNKEADVVIVGGGIAGVSIAYRLSAMGKKVILLEDGYIGSGETGRTTAHLANALDDRFYHLESVFGEEGSRLAAESHGSAIDFIERVSAIEGINCNFRRVDGYLFLHPSDKAEHMDEEFEAARRAGLDVEKMEAGPGLKVAPCLCFHGQACFHPMKYLKGLCEAAIRYGAEVYTETHVSEINGEEVVTDTGLHVKAPYIVVATNAPVSSKYVLPMKQSPYRSYVIAALSEKGRLPDLLWWDTGDFNADPDNPPYHYVRTEPYSETQDLLIVGGEDHPTGLADAEDIPEEERYEKLLNWAREHFHVGEVLYRWSGQVMEPVDSLGYIGRSPGSTPGNVLLVSGDSGHGMTHGTIAGMLIPDIIAGRSNHWEKLYSPSRFRFSRGAAWIKSMAGSFMDYLSHKPGRREKEGLDISELREGEGRIMRIDGDDFGVYRDDHNRLHFVSADCTHMGCTIKWNNDEKTWDCPCHGSRFSYTGEVLNGPANEPLDYYRQNPITDKIQSRSGKTLGHEK